MKKKMVHIPMPWRYVINAAAIAVIFLIFMVLSSAGVITNYYSKILMLIGINMILAVSLNLATGYLGQLPLGHAGFMAVGAYASGIFMRTASGLPTGLAVLLSIIIAAVVAGIFGFLIGIPALRLKGDYLAIITLGFGEIIRVVLLNIDSVLGFNFTYGAASLKNIPKTTTFTVTFLCVVVVCFFIHTMMKSRQGRAILSIRENEIAAESCGIKTTYYKTMAFVASAAFAGVAGSLYAGYLGILNPANFGFMKSIEILVMVVLGGMGSMIGSLLSATVLSALPEMLRAFSDYRMVAYSLLLILVMIFKPSGLMGTYDFSFTRLFGGLLGKKTGDSTVGKESGE
ncbi:MAG TPA: branched-chain amino acid ABC transporter permease [Papillibacter sp.]|jgi:branched-chain amino acid transport system permease protein|nr:branched-chain amino acid ABC transporter permease [Papillibacter sp.]